MDLWYLKSGHKIRIRDGVEAEVLSGTEDLAHRDEVEALLGVVAKISWGGKVTLVLHHIPESEESEGNYEAVTMKGVPHGVTIAGNDPDSAEGALSQLISGLKAFGFAGRVVVEDATELGPMKRYEVDLQPQG